MTGCKELLFISPSPEVAMAADQAAAPKKSSMSVSRIILLLILVAALGALGYDQYARYQMKQVDDLLARLQAESEDKSVQGLPKQKVRDEIGRQPTRTSSTGFQDIEEYDFPGVFYIYRLTVKYRRGIDMYDAHDPQTIFRFGGE
jgi:hypothetical protein